MAANAVARPVITFVTGNPEKMREVVAILGAAFPFELRNQAVDLPELQGEPQDIAKEKCKLAAASISGRVLVEDTSLCFNALGGLPGPYIKWFLKKTGHDGLNNLLAAYSDKSAYAQCIFALSGEQPGDEPLVFVGRMPGCIVPPRGENHKIGWDPVFLPEGFDLTYAELNTDVKYSMSYRNKALEGLKSYLLQLHKSMS